MTPKGRPTLTPPAAADPIDRLLAAFFSGRGPHTLDAYTRDLDNFLGPQRRCGDRLKWPFNMAFEICRNLAKRYQTAIRLAHESVTLADVVAHYNRVRKLGLTADQERDLAEYLRSL